MKHNLDGQRFGKLLVISVAPSSAYYTKTGKLRTTFSMWNCRCDCGTDCIVAGTSLKKGKTKSCGCKRRESKYSLGMAFGEVYRRYRQGAKKRGIQFELTQEQFTQLILSPCWYTGRVPSNTLQYNDGIPLTYNGIDRIDSSKGYTVENCVPCCYEINRAKSDMPQEAFLSMIKECADNLRLWRK